MSTRPPSARRGRPSRPAAQARGGQRRPAVAKPPPVVAAPPAEARRTYRAEPASGPARRGAEPHLPTGAPLLAPVLVTVLGAVLLGVGSVVAGVVLLVLGLGLLAAMLVAGSPARLAGRVGGREARHEHDERLLNLAEGLCVASGLVLPEVRILEDPAANAVLLAASSSRAVLIVTSGLLALLERIELEGVLAHELSHLRRGDAARAAGATRSAGLLAGFWGGTPLLVLRLAGREREARADLAAAALTRYPPGLAAALEKLAAAATRPAGLDAVTARLTAPLWCAPLEEGVPHEPLAGALSLTERAALLHEL
jgi:heat shock protein HtpX